ncbi:MAG: acyl-CoA thioesterase/bile acid-CoA:amino acid N-acyltransferase family protein [Pseudomonadota bacterium]
MMPPLVNPTTIIKWLFMWAVFNLLSAVIAISTASAQQFEFNSGTIIPAGDVIDVSITGLEPDSEVEVRASRVLKNHYNRGGAQTLRYRSTARFVVDESGRVDLNSTPSIGGSYEGIDANGLLWSMQPVNDESVSPDDTVELEAIIDGNTVASASFDLQMEPTGFTLQDVPSLPGSYFAPYPAPGDHPVIILIGGADSLKVNRETLMPQLVSQGYSVFHFATYEIIYGRSKPTVEGLPTTYVDIPLDQLQLVYDWLAQQDGVDEDRIGLHGFSRNGAYVLLAATRFSWVKAVAAIAPSDVVWEGWGNGVTQGVTSSYSWQGEPLPFVPYSDTWLRETSKFGRGGRGRLRTPMDEGRWANPDRVLAARIPVETYAGPLLAAGGEQDDLWSAGHMVQNVAERRAENGLSTELLVFPDAGHNLLGDGQSPIILLFEDEAVRPILARAQTQTWQATLDLFENALKPEAR